MQSSDQPTKVTIPFALAGVKRTIPDDSQIGITDGAASFQDGFPPKTFLPLSVGGVPPAGEDFNGILNAITLIQRWQSSGGLFKYDAAFATAVGGYPKGSQLISTGGLIVWASLVENNLTDPDDISSSGWKAQLGFTQVGANAILRDIEDKEREIFSITDFGTIGGTSANDTATLLKAITDVPDGGVINFPAGSSATFAMDALAVSGKSIYFVGNGAEIEVVAGSSTYVLNITDSGTISFSGFKDMSCATGVGVLLKFDPTSRIEKLVSDNNGFSGRFSFIRANGSTTQTPVTIPFGIGEFRYTNNRVHNMEISHVVLTDCPVDIGTVCGNTVRNFSYIFMQSGITNATVNALQLQAISEFNIYNNLVTNDDDHYHVGSAGSYYAFAQIECLTVNYRGNIVEGMKTIEVAIALYDAYLNCVNVTSVDNVYKNNANFATGANSNWVFKCKLDSTVSLPTTKVIKGNTVVIEDDWLKRIGHDTLGCSHRIYNTGVTNSGNVIIADNTIRLHTLYSPDNHYVESFTFSGNKIWCKKQESVGYVLMLSPATVGVSEAIVENNSLTVGDTSTISPALMQTATAASPYLWATVRVNGNSIYSNNTAVTSETLITGIRAITLIANNNSVNGYMFSCIYDCRVRNLYSANNSIVGSKTTDGTYTLRLTTLYGRSFVDQSYYGKPGLMIFTVHTSALDTPPSANTSYLIRVTFETATGTNSVEFKYTLAYAAGVYTVNWITDAAAARADIALTTAGDALLSQKILDGAGSLALTVQFRNAPGETYFRILGIPATPCKYNISVSVFE